LPIRLCIRQQLDRPRAPALIFRPRCDNVSRPTSSRTPPWVPGDGFPLTLLFNPKPHPSSLKHPLRMFFLSLHINKVRFLPRASRGHIPSSLRNCSHFVARRRRIPNFSRLATPLVPHLLSLRFGPHRLVTSFDITPHSVPTRFFFVERFQPLWACRLPSLLSPLFRYM